MVSKLFLNRFRRLSEISEKIGLITIMIKKRKRFAVAKEQNSEKTDEDYQQTKTKIEIMLKQLRGQMA
jgi:hypothetical protein